MGCGLLSAACGDTAGRPADHGTVTTPYLEIGKSLANDSIEGVATQADRLVEAANDQPDAPGMAAVLRGAGKVAANNLATARGAFKTMSDGVIENLRRNPAQQPGLMLVHCTMAFDGNGGLWVQREGKVANPYEGGRMPRCGTQVGWDAPLPPT